MLFLWLSLKGVHLVIWKFFICMENPSLGRAGWLGHCCSIFNFSCSAVKRDDPQCKAGLFSSALKHSFLIPVWGLVNTFISTFCSSFMNLCTLIRTHFRLPLHRLRSFASSSLFFPIGQSSYSNTCCCPIPAMMPQHFDHWPHPLWRLLWAPLSASELVTHFLSYTGLFLYFCHCSQSFLKRR